MQLVLLNRYFYALLGSSQQSRQRIMVHYLLSGTTIYLSSISFFPVLITGLLSINSAFIISWCYSSRIESKAIYSVLYVILGFIAETLSYGFITQVHLTPRDLDLSSQKIRLLILLFSSLIFFLFIMIIKLVKRQGDYKLNKWYYLVLGLINVVSLLILNTLFFHTQGKNNMYILSAFGILLINITIIYLFDQLIESFKMQDQLQQLHKQIDYQNANCQKITNSFQMTKRIIHDTNKHFIYIHACIQTGEQEKALEHINKTLKVMENSYLSLATGNLVVDALLNNAISIAKERNIHIKYQVSIDNLDAIDSYDLCIVIGNILDNAIEAAQLLLTTKERFISIRIFTHNHMLTIHIVNSYVPKKKSQKKSEFHGVGLLNVRQITEKYGGHITTKAGESFETAVVLPIYKQVT